MNESKIEEGGEWIEKYEKIDQKYERKFFKPSKIQEKSRKKCPKLILTMKKICSD